MSNASNQIAMTAKLFPDVAIEQIRGNRLLVWQDGEARLMSAVEYGGCTFKPAILNTLEHVLHLPVGTMNFGTLDDLVGKLREALTTCDAGLDQASTLLVATGTLATWVADCLPAPLVIDFWGEIGIESTLFDFLRYVCRRALRLTEPSPRELGALPAGLSPTLILTRPSKRTLNRLLAAACAPFLQGDEVVNVGCPMVVYTSQPLQPPALTVPLSATTHPLRRITRSEAQRIADDFQPCLLDYRLKMHASVANSQFDVPGFCPEIRQLARILGAAVQGSPSLQSSIVGALNILDERHRAGRSQTSTAVILEALLALSHRKMPAAYVGSICDLANDFLENREDPTQLSPKAVGEVLRQQLGLVPLRRAAGYELTLDVDTQQRLHRLAVAHDVLQRVADCPRCQEMLAAIPTQNQSTSGAWL